MPEVVDRSVEARTRMLVSELEQVATEVDEVCQRPVTAGCTGSMALAEASTAIQRALAALSLQGAAPMAAIAVKSGSNEPRGQRSFPAAAG
jgi:hypothetical protein